MKLTKIFPLLAAATLVLGGCASHTHELTAAHVSTTGYQGLECNAIHAEMQSNINRIHELADVLERKASNDEAAMAVGMILFWPALFALEGGDGPEAAEYSRLKGEMNAMEQVAIMKECEAAMQVASDYHKQEQEARVARLEKQQQQQQDQSHWNP